MKLGNLSQAIVPVPEFFRNKTTRNLETFSLPSKKQYYRETDLLSKIKDVNINHNPRFENSDIQKLNNEKYLPIYHNTPTSRNTGNTTTDFFPHIMDRTKVKPLQNLSEYGKFKSYCVKTNINEFLRPKLRDEIKEDVSNLLERINNKLDIKRWNGFDNKVTINQFYQTQYSPLTQFIKGDQKNQEDFNTTRRDKALSLRTINSKAKGTIINHTLNDKYNTEGNERPNEQEIDEMLQTCKTNLLELKKQNTTPFEYNEEDKKFIKENQYCYDRFNKTTLYKHFPSPTRMEFAEKKVQPAKKRFKILEDGNYVTKAGYSFSNMDFLSCQDELWKRPLHQDHFK